ncbi:MAG: RNA polymerase sigma factor [Acidobacteriota bacterium]|nr:RNA polymerase sigma factor [Acidobacteriota bacterium]
MNTDAAPRLGLEDRLAGGDPDAFRELVETYKRKFYGLAFEYTRNHADAEDVSQIAFIKVYRSIGTFQKGASLNSWLYRIVVNAAIDHLRKRPMYPSSYPDAGLNEASPAMTDPVRTVEASALRRSIDAALDVVSERERAAFLLRHDHGLSLNEIADTLDVSVGSVKSFLHRSARKLRKELVRSGLRLSEETPHA